MTTKLTLTLDNAVIAVAKKYAKNKGKSLSGIVENYLKSLASNNEQEEEISPRILKLMGCIDLPDDYDYKKELSQSIKKKYNR